MTKRYAAPDSSPGGARKALAGLAALALAFSGVIAGLFHANTAQAVDAAGTTADTAIEATGVEGEKQTYSGRAFIDYSSSIS